MPCVAVVMLDTNEGPFFERTLQCLREQTRRPDRIVVVDNASTDGSPEVIEERFPEAELIRAGRNVGFSVGNNIGVQAAGDCDWVVLLNADAYPEPGWLAALLDAAQRRPEFSFFACRMMRANQPGELDGAGDVFHVAGLAWRRDNGRPLERSPEALVEQEVFAACAGAAMYRRDAWMEVGGFDESFFAYLEDQDLSFRLRLAGHRCLYVPDAVVHHVGSATTGLTSDYTIYHTHRNTIWLWAKNMPWPLALLYLPFHVLINLSATASYALHGRGPLVVKAKLDGLKGLPRVLRERRRIQAGRRVGARELRRLMAKGFEGYVATSAAPRIDAWRDRRQDRVAAGG